MGQGDYPERMREPHPLRNTTVRVTGGEFKGQLYWIEDWQINVYGGEEWGIANGNMAAVEYALRLAHDQIVVDKDNHALKADNEVVYGKIGPDFTYSKMMHVSQLGEVVCNGRPKSK